MKRWHGLRLWASAPSLFLLTCAIAAGEPPPRFDFNIPASDALHSLQRLLIQCDFEALYSIDEIRDVSTPAVLGHLTVAEALERLLKDTPLQGAVDPNVPFISVTRKPTSASLSDTETHLDRDIPLRVLADDRELKEVVITGSLIRGVQEIISPQRREQSLATKATAYATVQDALQSIPLVSRGGPSEVADPGGNFGRGASVNLRGLGPGATLVLVNGRRQAPSGANADFVDVSNIPWIAVKQIDILPDGASALYGSDAIAGVVNIVMRDELAGAETQMRLSTAAGGGNETLIGQLFGTRWDSGKMLFSYQFWHRDALPAEERAYSADSDKTPLGGSNFASNRSNPGNLLNPFTGEIAYAIPRGQNGAGLTSADLCSGPANLENRLADVDLWPDVSMHSVYVTATQSLGSRWKAFAEGRFSQRDMTQRYYAADALLFVPKSNPYFIDTGAPFDLVAYSFDRDFGPVRTDGRTRNYAGSFGVSAELPHSWRASLSRAIAAEDLRWVASNQIDMEALNTALGESDPAKAFNPFGDGSFTPKTTLASIVTQDAERALSRLVTDTFVADGPIATLPSGRAQLAVGVDGRTDTLDRGPTGTGPAVRERPPFSRRVRSAYAELAVPLLGDPSDARAAPHIQLSLAGRADRYSDFGSTFNPKIGLEAVLSDEIKLRGTWGTSFAAPRLVDLYDTTQNHAALVPVADLQANGGRSLVLLDQGNNPDLQEERARTWTAGIDFAPSGVPGLAVSLTYFDIQYRDGVFVPAPPLTLDAIMNERQWSALVTRQPSAERVQAICASPGFIGDAAQCVLASPAAIIEARPFNLSSIEVRGLDLTAARSLETKIGLLNFAFDGSDLLSFDRAITRSAPTLDVLNTVDNPVARRARGTMSWAEHGEKGPGFGAQFSLDYSGRYRDNASTAHGSIESWLSMNANLSYRTPPGAGSLENLQIVASVTNLFNRDPPFVDREIGYDVVNARPYGRVVSLFLRKSW